MTAKDIFESGNKRFETFKIDGLRPALRYLNEGAMNDILNTNGCRYYQWSTCLVEEFKPKQIVELGGAMGVWDLCVLYTLPEMSNLFSITLKEHGLEFSYIKDKYNNFHPIIGDDLILSNWPKELDLNKTDIWFIDSLHEETQLRKELDLYSPFFKKNAIVLLDDIHINEGMEKVWDELCSKYDYYDATDPLHYSGFGILTI